MVLQVLTLMVRAHVCLGHHPTLSVYIASSHGNELSIPLWYHNHRCIPNPIRRRRLDAILSRSDRGTLTRSNFAVWGHSGQRGNSDPFRGKLLPEESARPHQERLHRARSCGIQDDTDTDRYGEDHHADSGKERPCDIESSGVSPRHTIPEFF